MRNLIRNAKSKFSDIDNLVLKSGDGFKKKDTFLLFLFLIYPILGVRMQLNGWRRLPFSHGVIMVQKEFADKLLAKSSKQRKAISIIATSAFEITTILKVGKNNFSPPPKIDSTVLKIIKKNNLSKELIQTINKIFSYRRKTVKNILKQFNKESEIDKRVDDLSGDEIISLANQILEK